MKNWFLENRFQLLMSVVMYLIFQGLYSFGSKDVMLYSWLFLYMGILIISYSLPQWKLLIPIVITIQIPMLAFIVSEITTEIKTNKNQISTILTIISFCNFVA